MKRTFAGHESFHCRPLWLSKGIEYIYKGKSFKDETAFVTLGVGKNMSSAINYWLQSFGLITKEEKTTQIADYIFGEKGVDKYLENNASLWLLHYNIIIENKASIYSLVFNEFRKSKIEFTKGHLVDFLTRKCQEENLNISINTIKRDITVFFRNYIVPVKGNKNFEELYSGLFIDLELINKLTKDEEEEHSWYKIENNTRENLPVEIVLYSILQNPEYADSIHFDQLMSSFNSPGNIFALTPEGLLKKINIITSKYPGITFDDHAGTRVLAFKDKIKSTRILNEYYKK